MAKKNGNGTPRSPHESAYKSPENRALLWANLLPIVQDLFNTLRSPDPTQNIDAFTSDLENKIDVNADRGILTQISATNSINFSFLSTEVIHLDEIKTSDLTNISGLQDPNLLRTFETALVKLIKNKLWSAVQGAVKRPFNQAISYHTTLIPLINAIEQFADTFNKESERNDYKKLISDFKFTYEDIRQSLASEGFDTSALQTGDFQSRTPDQKKLFDTMLSRTVVKRLQNRVNLMDRLITDTKDVFNNVLPPFHVIFNQYPFDREQLKAKYPTEFQDIEQMETQLSTEESEEARKLLSAQIEQKFREIYLHDLQISKPILANTLQKLYTHQFDFSTLTPTESSELFSELAKMRLEQMLSETQIREIFDLNVVNFEHFFMNLFDLNSSNLQIGRYNFPIQKTVLGGTRWTLTSPWDMLNEKDLPLEFKISGLNSDQISLENRQMIQKLFKNQISDDLDSVVLKGKEIWKLIYLYLMGKWDILDIYNPRNAKPLLDTFTGKTDVDPNKPAIDKPNREGPQNPENPEKPEGTPLEEIFSARDAMAGEKTEDPDHGLRPWAIIYFSKDESILPPYGDPSKEWMRGEITKVDRDEKDPKITVKFYGTEMSLWAEEAKELTFDSVNFKNLISKSENSNLSTDSIRLLGAKKTFKEAQEALSKAGIKPPILEQMQFENGKFVMDVIDENWKASKQEVNYFTTTDEVPDPNSSAMKKNSVIYKVKPNADGTVSVESDLLDMEWEKKRYERKMSYSDFLLFLNEKNLAPKTEKQVEADLKAFEDIPSTTKRNWKRVSVQSMIYSIKNVWKNLTSKIDEYYKEQDEACLDWLVSSVGIYKMVGNSLSWIPSVKSAADKLHYDQLSKAEKNTRKSIEDWIWKFKGMQDFSALFETGVDHPSGMTIDSAIGKGNTLKKILLSGKSVVEDGNLRPIMAAAMIANIRQGKGLYRWLSNYDNQGLWVKCLLGDQHHQRYMKMRQDVLDRIKKPGTPDADQLQDRLKKSEIDYIVNNINNANGGQDFGSVNDGNKQVLKQLYSSNFAWELNNAAEEVFWRKSIDSAYSKITHNNFNLAAWDFKRFIKSSRIESALANLKKMGDLARSEQHKNQLKMALSYITLSGIMNRYGDKDVRKWFDALARAYMVPTAFFAKKRENQHNARNLLDKVDAVPPFREAMKSKEAITENWPAQKSLQESDFSMNAQSVEYWALLDKLRAWRWQNTKKIDDYFVGLKSKDTSLDPIERKVQDQYRESSGDRVDDDRAKNPSITGNYALLAAPDVIEQNKDYNREGFAWKTIDERNDKADFRKKILSSLNDAKSKNIKPEFFLRQFLVWFNKDYFSPTNYPEIVSWIYTAKKVRQRWEWWTMSFTVPGNNLTITIPSGYRKRDAKDLLYYLFKGNVLNARGYPPPVEFEKVLDFFVNYFDEKLENINDDALSYAFWADDVKQGKNMKLWLIPRDEYNAKVDRNSLENFWIPQKNQSEEDKRKSKYYREWDLFLNKKLLDLERRLNSKGINAPVLSGVAQGTSNTIFDNMYGGNR